MNFQLNQKYKVSKNFLQFDCQLLPDTVVSPIWEAVVLITTEHEIQSGQLQRFVDSIPCKQYPIPIVLSFNHLSSKEPLILIEDKLKQYFLHVEIVCHSIEGLDDIYIRDRRILKQVPRLGYFSGPNLLFLRTMEYCKRFNTILLLETDCKLKEEWYDSCNHFVKSVGSFLIAGSSYKGSEVTPFSLHANFFHKNGVAFYQTGSGIFQTMIKQLDLWIQERVKKSPHEFYAYDVEISAMAFDQYQHGDHNQKFFWRYVIHQIIECPLIVNASLWSDLHYNPNFDGLYPKHVILHKK